MKPDQPRPMCFTDHAASVLTRALHGKEDAMRYHLSAMQEADADVRHHRNCLADISVQSASILQALDALGAIEPR